MPMAEWPESFHAIGRALWRGENNLFADARLRAVSGVIQKSALEKWPDIRSLWNDSLRQGDVDISSIQSMHSWYDGLDFTALPFFAWPGMRPYLTGSVFAVGTGMNTNWSVHRAMFLDEGRVAVRVVPRHLHALLKSARQDEVPAVMFFCHEPSVMLAASWPLPGPGGEARLAAALSGEPLELWDVDGIFVPRSSSLVVAGYFNGSTEEEGPFVDATGTLDPARQAPVFVAKRWWLRPDAVIPVIRPGGPEHHYLMGTPRAVAIYEAVSRVTDVVDVFLPPGGAGWLHAVVSVRPRRPGDAVNAGIACMAAHPSLKKVTVVDDDIDIRSADDVQWAVATRCRPDRDIHIISGAAGSTLDPSASGHSSKWICDATVPHGTDMSAFMKYQPDFD